MNSEAGYIGLELSQVCLAYINSPSEDVALKVEVSIQGSGENNILSWRKNKSPDLSTDKLTAFKQEIGEDSAGSKCVVDFNLFEKSSYINLDYSTVSKVINCVVVIKVLTESGAAPVVAAAPAPAKGKDPKGGAAPVVPLSNDVILVEAHVALSELLATSECCIRSPHNLSENTTSVSIISINDKIDPSLSNLSFSISADNDFAEFVTGGILMQWETAHVENVDRAWGLHMAEGPPEKSKVPPTEVELKAKYMDGLNAVINAQKENNQFTISLQPANPGVLKFPPVISWTGVMKFDHQTADSLSLEDVKNQSALWSIDWETPSSKAFFDRSVARELLNALEGGNDEDRVMNIEVKKTPSAAVSAIEGGPQVATGIVNVSELSNPGARELPRVSLPLADSKGGDSINFFISLKLSRPLRDNAPAATKKGIRPADVSSLHQVGGGKPHRDVFKELRDEISEVIKEVAAEYVAIYPAPPPGEKPDPTEIQKRKAHFFHHLSSSGIYHKLKENLKPRIQRAARKRFGARSRALGLAGSASFDSMALGAETELPLDQLLGELYVFLVQESNSVLNAMYRETVVECDLKEVERPPAIDDEEESPKQLFSRLLRLAFDAECSGDWFKAEQRHLERIQLLFVEKSFSGDTSSTRSAYASYATFLLHRAALELRVNSKDAHQTSLSNARVALNNALKAGTGDVSSDWELQLELGCLLLELGIHEEGIEMINKSVSSQLKNAVDSFDDFDGYESDKLAPVNPMCYVFMSLYFLERKKPLSARKATRLILKSYNEGEFEPHISTHGKPRRTATLAYSLGGLYANERGFVRLGKLSLTWAKQCEMAATEKAEERNLPANSPAMIRHILKLSSAMVELAHGNLELALQEARDSVSVAVDKRNIISGYVCTVKLLAESGTDNNALLEAFSQAISTADSLPGTDKANYSTIPLSTFLEAGQVYIATGNFKDGMDMMLLGCSVYASCYLFLLVGICCLRLDLMQDAEDALEEANLIDNRNPTVWAYLTLLCLNDTTGRRLFEANRCLEQSLRLGLTGPDSAGLLRELATAHVSVDKLSTAEDLLRRCLRAEAASSPNGKSTAYSRKLLADVLVGQNLLANAIEEYRTVISDEEGDIQMRLEACEGCISLLAALGRDEEIRAVAAISDSLKNATN